MVKRIKCLLCKPKAWGSDLQNSCKTKCCTKHLGSQYCLRRGGRDRRVLRSGDGVGLLAHVTELQNTSIDSVTWETVEMRKLDALRTSIS